MDGENVKIEATGQPQQPHEEEDDADTLLTEEELEPQSKNEEEQGDKDKGRRSNNDLDRPPRAVIQVNVTLDSSLDIDKLEKQLSLLRKYGAI